MALDPTVGGEDADSYVSLVEADAYLTKRLDTEAWNEADTPTQEAALVSAAYRLDQEAWRWSKASDTQALEFPRTGQTDKNGTRIDDDEIPVWLQRAQIELALALLSENTLDDTGLEGMRRLKVDVLEFEPLVGMPAGKLPAHVRRYIGHALSGTGSAVTFQIVRGG